MTQPDQQEQTPRPVAPPKPEGGERKIQDLLQIPWRGLRPDLILHPGPVDFDGERSWVLEDPVRGNNFRLGYAEGELLYRLNTYPDVDSAIRHLYATTTLRPSVQEILTFIAMLQRERLALLPQDEVVQQEARTGGSANPSPLQQLLQGNIFLRIPVLRPDRLLTRSLPWMAVLWSPVMQWIYLLCGFMGLSLTLQEIENYLGTVSYLFTPQGGLAFLACLAVLKIGHEFAHAYMAKSLGLHVRSMGIMLIVVWPLLYTDTTDVWKVPDRRQRMKVSAAGVLFELTVAGMALLFWAFLPDGILRSLMFFLSGTSLISSVLINLNPFMRYDGYYLLMDLWGIDNLRPRAAAILRHAVRKLLLDWQGPAPEFHPHRRALLIYGVLAALYRLFIGFSIAIGIYYLFFPALGMAVFLLDVWLFLARPLWAEVRMVLRSRQYLGAKYRLVITACGAGGLMAVLCLPLPRMVHVPCLLLSEGAVRVEAPSAGQLSLPLPREGRQVREGDLLTRLTSDLLVHEAEAVRFELAKAEASVQALGSGGEQGAYRKWILAEQERLQASLDKYAQAIAQLEIRAPLKGRITDVCQDLYAGAFVAKGAYLFTIAEPDAHELKAFIHEKLVEDVKHFSEIRARVRFLSPELPALPAKLIEKERFPVQTLPNDSLLDVAGGPIVSVQDASGRKPRDAYFAYTFRVEEVPPRIAHGMPSWVWIRGEGRPVIVRLFGTVWEKIIERGLF